MYKTWAVPSNYCVFGALLCLSFCFVLGWSHAQSKPKLVPQASNYSQQHPAAYSYLCSSCLLKSFILQYLWFWDPLIEGKTKHWTKNTRMQQVVYIGNDISPFIFLSLTVLPKCFIMDFLEFDVWEVCCLLSSFNRKWRAIFAHSRLPHLAKCTQM